MRVGDLLGPALVRFRGVNGAPVGAGLLFAPDRVATCAHVVAALLGADEHADKLPAGALTVEFPLLSAGNIVPSVDAEVIAWQAVAEDGTGDVAVLRLLGDTPLGAVPPPLVGDDGVWGHRFRVCGFPAGHDDGRWLGGELRARQGTGWLQLEADTGQAPVERGFSGAPVWDETTGGVAGLVVTAADRGTAFLLPIAALGVETSARLPEPFRGLDAFGVADAEFFHGRDREIARLLDITRTRPLVVVAGPSGSGKSSLVRAGLLSCVQRAGTAISELQRTPGVGAVATLADLLAGLQDGDRHRRRDEFRQRLARGEEEIALLAADLAREAGQPGAMLFIDQFEEVVADDRDTARELLRLLVTLLAAQPREPWLRAAITLRSGSLDELLTTELAGALEHAVTFTGPMDAASMRAAVTEPVQAVGGVAFEDGLVERILADAGAEPGRLPLIEFTLTELWRRRQGGRLTHDAYDEIGGVSGALARYAERGLWQGLTDSQRNNAKRLLSRLARPAEGGGFTRHRARVSDLEKQARSVLDVLAATRLVVVSEDSGVVELAHQALIEEWDRLREWLVADREFLAWRDELAQRRDQWDRTGRDRRSLLGGIALVRAGDWRARRGADLSEVEQEFIARSHARQRRRVWGWRVAGTVVVVVALVVGLLAAQTARQRDQLDERLRHANATLLAQQVGRITDASSTAPQLAQAAWRESPGNPDAFGALWDQYVQWQSVDHVYPPGDLLQHPEASASANGDVIAVKGNADDAIVVWQGAPTLQPRQVTLPEAAVGEFTVSPDGRMLAIAQDGGGLSLWRIDGPPRQQVRLLPPNYGNPNEVNSLRFSADSRFLAATFRESGQLQRWDTTSGQSLPSSVNPAPGRYLASAIPLSDGKTVLVEDGSDDNPDFRTSLRDLGTGAIVRTFHAGDPVVLGDGAAIADCLSGTLRITDTQTGADRTPAPAPQCDPARFQNDRADLTGQFVRVDDDVAESSFDIHTYLHWPSGRRYTVEASLRGKFAEGAGQLDPDGGFTLLFPITDTLARLRAPRPDAPLPVAVPANTDGSPPVFSPDGSTSVVTAQGGRLVLVDSTSGAERASATAPAALSDSKPTVVFTPDGTRVVAASRKEMRVYRSSDLGLERVITLPRASDELPEGEKYLYRVGIVALTGDELVVLDRNQLSWWRLSSGSLLGDPVVLPADPTQIPYGRENNMVARPGHHAQVVVDMGATLAIWDLAQRRLVGQVANHVAREQGQFAVNATGSRLTAVNADQKVIDVWDLDSLHSLPTIPSGAGNVIGFAADLVVLYAGGTGTIELWRGDTPVRVGETHLELGTRQAVYLHGDTLVYATSHNAQRRTAVPLVLTLRLDPQAWFRRLCQINDRDFTPAELARFPQGASSKRPCDEAR